MPLMNAAPRCSCDGFGQDVAGLDAVDIDAVAGEFQRSRPDEAVDAGLAGRVMAVAGAGDMRAGDGRGEEHAPKVLRLHRHQCGACGVESAAKIDRHDAVPVVGAGVFDQLPGVDAGVLDDDVEAAVALNCKRHGGLGIGHLRDVGADEGGAELVRGRLPGLRLAVGQHQLRAFLGKAQRDALADAARCADDQRDLAFEPAGHASLCRMVCLSASSSTAARTSRPWMTWVEVAGRPMRLIAVLMADSNSTPA